jgi:hypothetical protein
MEAFHYNAKTSDLEVSRLTSLRLLDNPRLFVSVHTEPSNSITVMIVELVLQCMTGR